MSEDSSFDVELVGNVIFKLQRGKAADWFNLSAENLLFCHPIISVLLSKLFCLITTTRYIPVGFNPFSVYPGTVAGSTTCSHSVYPVTVTLLQPAITSTR